MSSDLAAFFKAKSNKEQLLLNTQILKALVGDYENTYFLNQRTPHQETIVPFLFYVISFFKAAKITNRDKRMKTSDNTNTG